MRRACIDIGSNTTRLLVADCEDARLREVHQERAFTTLGHGLAPDGAISTAKIAELVQVVGGQLAKASALGAAEVRGVATAAIRRARNGPALVSAIESGCGLRVEVLSAEHEARLAFRGAACTLDHAPEGPLGVVDVGGGSSELVVGTAPAAVSWWTSFGVGSGDLAAGYLHGDPPSAAELDNARARVASALQGIDVPRPAEAVAVGGSAASLRRVVGPLLDAEAFARSLALLTRERASVLASRFSLDVERVRLLPAGLVILQAASELFELPLLVGFGGVREGVLLEACL